MRVSPQANKERESPVLLTSLLLCFYSKHLEYPVAIYSVLQSVLFLETAESHQRNFWDTTYCKIILGKSGIVK